MNWWYALAVNARLLHSLTHAQPGIAVEFHQVAHLARIKAPRWHKHLLPRTIMPLIDKALTFHTCAGSDGNDACDRSASDQHHLSFAVSMAREW